MRSNGTRQVVVDATGQIVVVAAPDPVPGAGEAVVRLVFGGI